MINPEEVTVIFGIKGCGKSTFTEKIYSRFPKVIVFDKARTVYDDTLTHDVNGFRDFVALYADIHDSDSFGIRVSFRAGLRDDDFQLELSEILRVIYEIGKRKREQGIIDHVCIVFEELQFYCTPYFINPWLKDCILVGRHASLTIIGNTQRPANIHGDFKSQSANLICGQLYHKADIQYLRDSALGDDAFLVPTLPKYSFIFKHYGDPIQIIAVTP